MPGRGQSSQPGPQPRPPPQQHSALVTASPPLDGAWHTVCSTSEKQGPRRTSAENEWGSGWKKRTVGIALLHGDRRSCVYKGAPESLTAAPVPGVRPSQLLFSSSFKRPLWAGAGARAVAEATDLKIRELAPGCRPWLLSESQGQLPSGCREIRGSTGSLESGEHWGVGKRWWHPGQMVGTEPKDDVQRHVESGEDRLETRRQ